MDKGKEVRQWGSGSTSQRIHLEVIKPKTKVEYKSTSNGITTAKGFEKPLP
jgi:hypothetical protein